MGGFGSMSSMNSSLKENRRLRKEKKSFKDRNAPLDAATNSSPLHFNKMTVEEKVLFLNAQKREKRMAWIKISLVGAIIITLTGVFVVWIGTL